VKGEVGIDSRYITKFYSLCLWIYSIGQLLSHNKLLMDGGALVGVGSFTLKIILVGW